MILIPAGFSLVMDAVALVGRLSQRLRAKLANLPVPDRSAERSGARQM